MTVIKHTNNSSSFFETEEEYSVIASGANSVGVTRDGGAFISGPVSFSSPLTSMRFGAIFKFNPLVATCIPSTLATPISTFTLDLPLKNVGMLALVGGIVGSITG